MYFDRDRSGLRILQVSTSDFDGGAEKVAWNLFQSYRRSGHLSWLAVGRKRNTDPDVLLVPELRRYGFWPRLFRELERCMDVYRGRENFSFPETWRLLDGCPQAPHIVHCHNLHGGYFDLRILPSLSRQVPVVLTLHDAWLLSGHCAHSFDCERWKIGCGRCPDLTIYPAIRFDATNLNWRRKQEIYSRCKFYVATPCQWLMRKVAESMLAPALVESRVIPYGVDLSIFRPADQRLARSRIGISHEAKVILFAANGIRGNIWKDFQTMRTAVVRLGERFEGVGLIFLALGEQASSERIGCAEIRFVPFQKSPELVATYYQAADLYIHAAKVDTFPNAVLEALACGTPVVATAVGGIPEQLKCVSQETRNGKWNSYCADRATGVLVSAGDAEGIAAWVKRLLDSPSLLYAMGKNASMDAQQRFDLNREATDYLTWYKEILEQDMVEDKRFVIADSTEAVDNKAGTAI